MAVDVVLAVNGTSGVIPRYAAVEPAGSADAAGRVVVRKATRADSASVLFNGPLEVPAGGAFGAYPPTPTAVAGIDVADLPLGTDVQVGTRVGEWFLRSGQKGFRTLAAQTEGAVMVLLDPAGSGFYAALSGTTSPYGFAEVVGPAVGSAAVTGGRTGAANATEVLTGLAAIPSGTIVWMTAGGVTAYQFPCAKVVYVDTWQITTTSPCVLTPLTTKTYYLSGPNLCARVV